MDIERLDGVSSVYFCVIVCGLKAFNVCYYIRWLSSHAGLIYLQTIFQMF